MAALMKAAHLDEIGGAEKIRLGEFPVPEVGPGQVRIAVEAIAINPIDTYVRSGAVAFDLPRPFFPGCDAAGTVEALGPGVEKFRVGDPVWCTNQGLLGRQGTAAERIVIDECWCFERPTGVSAVDAAACALVGVTAHLGLFREAMLRAGETVLIIGGSGGVGSMVVQMVKAAGGTVIATAGSQAKADAAAGLGADHVVRYDRESIAEATRHRCPGGVNVFWETRRSPGFDLACEVLAPRGRMVLMAGREARPEFPVGPFYVGELSLHGFVMFKATAIEMRHAAEQMNHWAAAGKLRPHIAATYPLSELATAHRHQEAITLGGAPVGSTPDRGGKVVVVVD